MPSSLSSERNPFPGVRIMFPAGLAAFLIAGVFAIDHFVLEASPFREGPPLFDGVHLLRSILVLLASLILIGAIVRAGATGQGAGAAIPGERSRPWHRFAPEAAVLAAAAFLTLFLLRPETFSRLGWEWRPVELLSAAFLFLSGILFLDLFRLRRRAPSRSGQAWAALAFSLLFLFMGLEEVSWFQKLFDIETPALFETNLQHELNLHNFATNQFENAYYAAAFLFLVLVPFVQDRLALFRPGTLFFSFAPSRNVLASGAIFAAYNYDMWNNPLIQLSFFSTLFIIATYLSGPRSRRPGLPAAGGLLVMLASTQLLFLVFGSRFVRLWDATEYKELFIPFAFLVYALESVHEEGRPPPGHHPRAGVDLTARYNRR